MTGHANHRHTNERRVGLAALATGAFMIVEFAGGLLTGSLALLADAGHMLADFASLALAWVAFRVARRPADARRTYGFDRLEVLAAFVNGLLLLAIAVWIVVEAGQRLLQPVTVLAAPMLAVAVLGLLVNVGAFAILHGADRSNLNVRAASMHVIGDLLGSVAAIAAAAIILATGWMVADPLLSLLVAGLIFRGGWRVVGASGHILIEGAPEGLETASIAAGLRASLPEVLDVHHVHAWSVTQDRPMITLHARLAAGADQTTSLRRIKEWLRAEKNIDHATVEIEWEDGIADGPSRRADA